MFRSITATLLALVLTFPAVAAHKPLDAAELQVALRKLNVIGSALYVAAHPDDENTALISWMSRDRLLRTGYLAMTRGDGGQNLIGNEKGELLGVIRTQELLAARRVDGGEQFFTRAVDFGYSKTPTETLAIWGHDKILADTVWVIRNFQPDVIITRFPTTGEGGHGHHTASAMLAVEAFKAAADPTKFPEQLKHVNIWQPKRIYWNKFVRGSVNPDDPAFANSLRVDIGAFNPVLGRAYTEIAAESRSMHKSQGFGAAERRGSTLNYLDLLAGDAAKSDPFEGIDTTWNRYPGGDAVGKLLQQAADSFDHRDPSKSLPTLLLALDQLDRLGARPEWNARINPWIAVKRRDLLEVIRGCAGIAIDVTAPDSAVVPGAEIPVTVSVVNRSTHPFTLSAVASPYGNPSKGPGTKLEPNQPARVEIPIKLPADYPITQPYWLEKPPTDGAFTVDDQKLIGLADNPPPIPLTISLTDNAMRTLIYSVPAEFRWTDAVRGDQVRKIDVVPHVTANIASGVYVFPDAKPKQVSLSLQNHGAPESATVRLTVPGGWSVNPPSQEVTFAKKGDEARATFTVTPPKQEGTGSLSAEVTLKSGAKTTLGITTLDYEHFPAQRVFHEAKAKLIRSDIRKSGSRVGYVAGAGDEIPEALRQLGFEVVMLSDEDLERSNFAGLDAIVVGVRAYNARKSMPYHHPRLMKWVEAGGTLVVQYSSLSPQPLLVQAPGPFPMKIGTGRVTDEKSAVTFVDPASPVLNAPNKITPADFEGWVQERGVYFVQEWDPQYKPMISTTDPGEPAKEGAQLYARHGKGVFIYTSLAWFRQLPAGVPGAYRMFANLVSAR